MQRPTDFISCPGGGCEEGQKLTQGTDALQPTLLSTNILCAGNSEEVLNALPRILKTNLPDRSITFTVQERGSAKAYTARKWQG